MNDNLKVMDKAKLYRLETVVDRNAGKIDCLWPVKVNGEEDFERTPVFMSSVVLTNNGMPFNVGFEIDAKTLDEAIDRWHEAAIAAAKGFEEQLRKDAQRPRIVMPGGGVPPKAH